MAFMAEVDPELLQELQEHALVPGDFTLSSGTRTSYYVDVKRALMTEAGSEAVGRQLARYVREWKADAVGGLVVGAVPVACAVLRHGLGVRGFFVRDEAKPHGLRRQIEGPELASGSRCLIVDDVVTTGGSTLKAIHAVQSEGFVICGVVVVVDRLAGGGEAITREIDAPYVPLATIDDVYPSRPDRPEALVG